MVETLAQWRRMEPVVLRHLAWLALVLLLAR